MCGPRRRSRNVIRKDLKDISVAESKWYEFYMVFLVKDEI